MKLQLPQVTLLCADCLDTERAIAAMERTAAKCDFGAVKFLTSLETDYPHTVKIPHLGTLVDYSVFCLKKLHEYVDTTHMLTVQHDGWVLNQESWNPAWLNYDYIGSLFIHRHEIGPQSVGSGGFSLRSRRLMQRVSESLPPWTGTPENIQQLQQTIGAYEDGFIAIYFRHFFESQGFRYAPPEEAARFSQGGNLDPRFHVRRPFGFHGLWTEVINFDTGEVGPWPTYEDRRVGYAFL